MRRCLKVLCLTLFLLSFLPIYGQKTPSTFSGFSFTMKPEESSISLSLEGMFATQFTIKDALIFRGDFRVRTEDILSNGLFQDTPSYFTIHELNFGYKFSSASGIQQVSIFMGKNESLGSDSFLKKFFGVRSFSSPILYNPVSLSSAEIYPYSGLGLSYTIKLATPKAFGLYFYYDDKYGFNNLNGDFRFAGTWNNIILDFGVGITLPIEHKDSSGNDVLLLIQQGYVHTGLTLLLGNTQVTNLFFQAGILHFKLIPKIDFTTITLEDIYVLLEPRFTTRYTKCSLSLFLLPENTLSQLPFVLNPLGLNLKIGSYDFYLFNNRTDMGIHLSASMPITDNKIEYSKTEPQIVPYFNFSLLNGTLFGSCIVTPLQYKDMSKFIKITCGFKTQI